MPYVISLTLSQSFLPIYQRLCPTNIFDKEQTIFFGVVYMGFMLASILIIFLQKKIGPRFFVPKRFRLNPNVYDYYVKIKNHNEATNRSRSSDI